VQSPPDQCLTDPVIGGRALRTEVDGVKICRWFPVPPAIYRRRRC
jgi:hypothetical protein